MDALKFSHSDPQENVQNLEGAKRHTFPGNPLAKRSIEDCQTQYLNFASYRQIYIFPVNFHFDRGHDPPARNYRYTGTPRNLWV